MANIRELTHYTDSPEWCEKLNALTQSVWGIRVLNGGEKDYIPFSKVRDDEVIANVCVGAFDVVVNGFRCSANMIQTVLTKKEHRNQGLIRELFTPVQAMIRQESGRTFFTAHKDKKEFYRQFGYHTQPLIDHFTVKVTQGTEPTKSWQPIDIKQNDQWNTFQQVAEERAPVSSVFGFVNRNWLLFWFVQNFYQENIYWLDDLNVYLIAKVENNRLDIYDIVGASIPSFAQLTEYLDTQSISKVRIFFSPDRLNVKADAVANEDDYFFADSRFPIPEKICLPQTQRG